MNPEPTITIPVIAAGNTARRQYVTTLSLKAILVLADPILQRKKQGRRIPSLPRAAPQIAAAWTQRGEIQSITPIVIAIDPRCSFKSLDASQNAGPGLLECPWSAILDICDGIQRITALQNTALASAELTANEWPVHLIETNGHEDLAALTGMIRNQTTESVQGRRAERVAAKSRECSSRVIAESRFLRAAVATRKSTISTRSSHLWAGSAITMALHRAFQSVIPQPTSNQVSGLAALWDRLPGVLPQLADYAEGRILGSRIRDETILNQSPTVHALAIVLAQALVTTASSQEAILQKLGTFNWSVSDQIADSKGRIQLREERTRLLLDHCGINPDSKPVEEQ